MKKRFATALAAGLMATTALSGFDVAQAQPGRGQPSSSRDDRGDRDRSSSSSTSADAAAAAEARAQADARARAQAQANAQASAQSSSQSSSRSRDGRGSGRGGPPPQQQTQKPPQQQQQQAKPQPQGGPDGRDWRGGPPSSQAQSGPAKPGPSWQITPNGQPQKPQAQSPKPQFQPQKPQDRGGPQGRDGRGGNDGRSDGRDGRDWNGGRDGRGDSHPAPNRGDRDRGRPKYDPHRYPTELRSRQHFYWRGPTYYNPPGYYAQFWSYGETLPWGWYAPNYYIDNWSWYGLDFPPAGFEWVRSGRDALLVDVWSGRIYEVVYDLFW